VCVNGVAREHTCLGIGRAGQRTLCHAHSLCAGAGRDLAKTDKLSVGTCS
jgi:hypothetical protein